jgi:hypothetical protein
MGGSVEFRGTMAVGSWGMTLLFWKLFDPQDVFYRADTAEDLSVCLAWPLS